MVSKRQKSTALVNSCFLIEEGENPTLSFEVKENTVYNEYESTNKY